MINMQLYTQQLLAGFPITVAAVLPPSHDLQL
jgi:hypothetical protein